MLSGVSTEVINKIRAGTLLPSKRKDAMKITNKTPKDKIIKHICNVMLGRAGNGRDGFAPWDNPIVVTETGGVRSAFLVGEEKVLSPISQDCIAALVIRYCDEQNIKNLTIEAEMAKKIARTFLLSKEVLGDDEVKLFRQMDEPGYCHFRQPYNILENVSYEQMEGCCPNFAGWVRRIRFNKEALIHFIGSIFEEDSYNQQYLVIKGQGGDGKGSLLNCLHKFFGPLYGSSFTSRIKDRDWTATTYRKRVVTFPDAQSMKFLNYEIFKSITGGNSVPYRNLYEKEHHGISEAKFIVCTNEDVDVTGMLSDARRRIYCEIEPPKKVTPNYQAELMEESQIFFSYCHSEFVKNCQKDLPISTDKSVELLLEENSYDEYDFFFDQYLAPNGSVKRGDVHQLFKHQISRSGRDFNKFKRYLTKVHGVQEIRIDGKWRLKGVCIRANAHSMSRS